MSAAVSSVYSATSTEASKYKDILNRKINEGARSAMATIQRIHEDVPTDRIVSTRSIEFEASERGLEVIVGAAGTCVHPTDYAIGQIAARAAVPTDYLRSLASRTAEPWQHELAAEVLRRHYRNRKAERALVRSVGSSLRGWLSDRYRRLDARPLLEALMVELQGIGAVPYFGTSTDTRVALKALLPEILEPVPGEFMVLGLEWSNSDYGNGPHRLATFALRVACLNGMTRENALREIHLGGRLAENIEYSNRTYELDTKASVSALRDTVKGVLGPAARDRMMDEIRGANSREVSVGQLRTQVRNLPAKTQKAVVDAFESGDVINLPAGNTAWRASNAVSWIARHLDSDEDRLDLERLAGKIAAPTSGKN